MTLTGKQRRHLRALGHGLAPVAMIGKGGLTDAFVEGLDQALGTHELVKLKLLETAALDRHEAAAELARRTQAEVAQDAIVDAAYRALTLELQGEMMRDRDFVDRGIHLQACAKFLERIGDHGTNLAELVIFQVEGKDIRHPKVARRENK